MEGMDDENVEKWLVLETRSLPMPDGSKKVLREMRMLWAAFDSLINDFLYTPEQLVSMCLEEAQLKGQPFEEIFGPAVAYLDREHHRICRGKR